ncbi:hypothetical protein CERSUDRAFT_109648 [Gelatoporia subvermispora B]|uniref:Uncharacterized protein n=1 Tax=Ceriporiopsis subvermispora (strain B) TaxID=914234 RepID=M2Q2S0_CERS8|nr:hypothetical protein CERSUDRAFT_109648 [Gelatoporia subvermispora B]
MSSDVVFHGKVGRLVSAQDPTKSRRIRPMIPVKACQKLHVLGEHPQLPPSKKQTAF